MRLAFISTLLLLAACQQEPSFDERYSAAQQKVGSTARKLDNAMVEADRAAEADRRALQAARNSEQKGEQPPAT